jgi:hypothetical protein
MTEADWLSDETSGRLLEYTRRVVGLSPQARSRKYRLAAVEILHSILGSEIAPRVVAVMEVVERLCEGQATPREVDAAVRAAVFPVHSDAWPNWGYIANSLGNYDALSGVRGIAGATQFRPTGLPSGPVIGQPEALAAQCRIIRDIFGNPFRPVAFSPEWRTDTAVSLARTMYESRDFSAMPILADALQDAGCDEEELLGHCRGHGRDTSANHVRGCWVVDLVLGKA